MKKISLIGGAILVLLGLTSLNSEPGAVINVEQNINFYQTNLICGAAQDIGCGTRSKPILMSFIKHEAVDEAWLNHPGTIIAVVWSQGLKVNRSDVVNKIFASYEQPFQELTGNDYAEQMTDFKNGKWYKGDEVDQLSMIEANRMANRFIGSISDLLQDDPQMEATLQSAFENYIKEEFLKIEDATVINERGYWERWETELTAIGKEHLGEKMPEIKIVSNSIERKLDKSNCTKDSKSSCCKKGS